MKSDRDPRRLLDEVLEDAPDFRAAMLDRTLGEVRRKRQRRQWGRGTAAAALVMGLGILAWKTHLPLTTAQKPSPSPVIAQAGSLLPVVPAATPEVATTPAQLVPISPANVAMVETAESQPDFRVLTDEELLTLAGNGPSIILWQGPHQAQLLVADELTQRFPKDHDLP
jgi:hypothetical protein